MKERLEPSDCSIQLALLRSLAAGAFVPPSPPQRLMLVLPSSKEPTTPVSIDEVCIEHLLANIVALLNAPERQRQGSLLAIGICPVTRQAIGVSMHFNDQDAFRIGFDQCLLTRIRPAPLAESMRLHFVPLAAEAAQWASCGEMTPRAESERLQKMRRPTLIGAWVRAVRELVNLCTLYNAYSKFYTP